MNLFKRQNGIYYIKISDINGKEKRISTRCKKKKDALQFLANYKLVINKPPEVKAYYFNEIVDSYLALCEKRFTPKYYSIMKYTLEKFTNFIGDIELTKISSQKCEKFIMQKYSKAKCLSNQSHRNLRTFFICKDVIVIVTGRCWIMKKYENIIVLIVGIIGIIFLLSYTGSAQNKIKNNLHGTYQSITHWSPLYVEVDGFSSRKWFSNKIKVRNHIYEFSYVFEGDKKVPILIKGDKVWQKYKD